MLRVDSGSQWHLSSLEAGSMAWAVVVVPEQFL